MVVDSSIILKLTEFLIRDTLVLNLIRDIVHPGDLAPDL